MSYPARAEGLVNRITEASPSDCLVSYLEHVLGESYPSKEMQSVYSTALGDWAICVYTQLDIKTFLFQTIQFSISTLFFCLQIVKCTTCSISNNSV